MPISITGTVSINASVDSVSTVNLRSVTDPIRYGANYSFTNGTGANQANQTYADVRTLAASGTENIDLAGGLTDAHGVVLTFTKIKSIIIKASTSNTNNVVVTRPATNGLLLFTAASAGISLPPGAGFAVVAPDLNGIAVTAATGDLLTITNSAAGTSVSYDIIIVGVV